MYMYNNTNLALNNELVFVHVFRGNNTLQKKQQQNLDLMFLEDWCHSKLHHNHNVFNAPVCFSNQHVPVALQD